MMSAEDARRMTADALGPDAELIRPYMEHVEARVRAAVAAGKRRIDHPLSGLGGGGTSWIAPATEDAVRKALEAAGYTWTHYPDPDPGHPAGGAYDTLSW